MFLFSESEYKISIFYPKQQIFVSFLAIGGFGKLSHLRTI